MVIKDGDVLEKYLEVDTFLFDKTNFTSRRGYHFGWKRFFPFGDYTEKDIEWCMFGEHIYHPIANTIVKQAEKWRLCWATKMHGFSMLQT